jgi:hypothetical protein
MELENPYGAYYFAAQIVLFRESDPTNVTVIAGGEAGKLCANASWTDDGALIYVHQDDPSDATATRLKRAHFVSLPTVSTIDAIPLPAEFVLPSDPHQVGASDSTGSARARIELPNELCAFHPKLRRSRPDRFHRVAMCRRGVLV